MTNNRKEFKETWLIKMKCCILFPKCTKTYLHTSAIPKFFPGLYPGPPLKRKEWVLCYLKPDPLTGGKGYIYASGLHWGTYIPIYYCRLALLLANHHRVHCPALTMQTRQLFYQVKTLKLTTHQVGKI